MDYIKEILKTGFFNARVKRAEVKAIIKAIVRCDDKLYVSRTGQAWAWAGSVPPLVDAQIVVPTTDDAEEAAYALLDAAKAYMRDEV